jgi:hypothetical protein
MFRFIICFSILLQGCASHTVRCESHLQPINVPASKSAP